MIARWIGRLLALVAGRGSASIPFVQQTAEADCGPACLAMVLSHLGRPASLDSIVGAFDVGPNGVTALQIVEVARRLGLPAVGVQIEADSVDALAPASILHWRGNHFVVLQVVHESFVEIVDPAVGHARIPTAEFCARFSGTAIVFDADLRQTNKPQPPSLD